MDFDSAESTVASKVAKLAVSSAGTWEHETAVYWAVLMAVGSDSQLAVKMENVMAEQTGDS